MVSGALWSLALPSLHTRYGLPAYRRAMASGAASSRSASQPATDASLTEDRLGETTPVQIFHPLIRIDSEEEEEEEKESSEEEGGQVYRLQFPSGVYLREYPLLRLPGLPLGDRLFLFRNRNGPGP